MNGFNKKAWGFLKSEDGPAAIEYAVILSAIIAVCVATIATFGNTVLGLFQRAL